MSKKLPRPLIKNIAFFGDANIPRKDPVYKRAFNTAKLLASEGYTIVNGGGPGVMEASTKGAEVGGGETLSITFSPTDAPGFEGKYIGNMTDKEITTTNYIDRMFKLIEHADFFIFFKGGSGTISEFGTAWVLAKLYYGHHKPFILFGRFWIEIIDVFKKNMNLDQQELGVFEICEKKEEVLEAIKKFEKILMSHENKKHCVTCVDKAFIT